MKNMKSCALCLSTFYEPKNLSIPFWVPKIHSPKKVQFGFQEVLECTGHLKNQKQMFLCNYHYMTFGF